MLLELNGCQRTATDNPGHCCPQCWYRVSDPGAGEPPTTPAQAWGRCARGIEKLARLRETRQLFNRIIPEAYTKAERRLGRRVFQGQPDGGTDE